MLIIPKHNLHLDVNSTWGKILCVTQYVINKLFETGVLQPCNVATWRMTATSLAKRDSVVESDLGDVWPPAVDDEVAEAFAEVGLVVQAPAIGQHLNAGF